MGEEMQVHCNNSRISNSCHHNYCCCNNGFEMMLILLILNNQICHIQLKDTVILLLVNDFGQILFIKGECFHAEKNHNNKIRIRIAINRKSLTFYFSIKMVFPINIKRNKTMKFVISYKKRLILKRKV